MRDAMSFDPRSISGPGFWTRESGWACETADDALARVDERARQFVRKLSEMVRQEPVFLRSAAQPQDSFLVFDRPVKPFAVQLDPEIEVVVVFDPLGQQEFGDWVTDRYDDALRTVQQRYGAGSEG